MKITGEVTEEQKKAIYKQIHAMIIEMYEGKTESFTIEIKAKLVELFKIIRSSTYVYELAYYFMTSRYYIMVEQIDFLFYYYGVENTVRAYFSTEKDRYLNIRYFGCYCKKYDGRTYYSNTVTTTTTTTTEKVCTNFGFKALAIY